MSNGAKLLLVVVLVPIVAGVGVYKIAGGAATSGSLAALEQRPYTERDLASEYGLRPAGQRRSGGPLGYLSQASDANKLNNCVEAEASRIQIEYEDAAGFMALLRPVSARRIARQRFADQNLLPPGD